MFAWTTSAYMDWYIMLNRLNEFRLSSKMFWTGCKCHCYMYFLFTVSPVFPLKESQRWALTMDDSWRVAPRMWPFPSLWWPRRPWMCIVSVSASFIFKMHILCWTGSPLSSGRPRGYPVLCSQSVLEVRIKTYKLKAKSHLLKKNKNKIKKEK